MEVVLDLDIPSDWQKLSEKRAAEIIGIPRTSFRRKHLEDGSAEVMTVIVENGKKLIPFSELFRVYGERALTNLRDLQDDKEEQTIEISLMEYIHLKGLEKEVEQLRSYLEDMKEREIHSLKRSDLMFEEMQLSRRLLENKNKKFWNWGR